MAKQDLDENLNATVDLAIDRLDGLTRSLSDDEGDGPIDNFISEFLKRHQIGKDDSSASSSPAPAPSAPDMFAPAAATPTVVATSAGETETTVEAPPSRRAPKPAESVNDRMAMRQLANTIAKCVLESHGRVVMAQRAMALFFAGLLSVVAATAMGLASRHAFSPMYFGALLWYAIAVYSTTHFWVLTSRLNAGRANRFGH